eukprot:563971-Alexandrium_andersonii.AAC.1
MTTAPDAVGTVFAMSAATLGKRREPSESGNDWSNNNTHLVGTFLLAHPRCASPRHLRKR